jgi:hypothetical protein
MFVQFCVSSRAVCRRMLPVVARTAPSTQLSASSRLVVAGNFPPKQTSHSKPPMLTSSPPPTTHRSWCCWIHFLALPLERSALFSWCVFCSFVSSLLRLLFLRVQSVSSPGPHNKQQYFLSQLLARPASSRRTFLVARTSTLVSSQKSLFSVLLSVLWLSQHLLICSTDLVYGPDKAKVPLPAASPEEVVGWALHTVGVSQRNADKLLEQEIDGADIVHLSKLPESEIKAELLAAPYLLSGSAALKLSGAISDFGAAANGTRGECLFLYSNQHTHDIRHLEVIFAIPTHSRTLIPRTTQQPNTHHTPQ